MAEKTPPGPEQLPPPAAAVEEEELQPAAPTPRVSPPTDEVTDLSQRLAVLQGKRSEDKARIKELEKYKAHYMQVNSMGQNHSKMS